MSTKDISQINQQLTLAMQRNDEANFSDFCWTGNELLHQQILALFPSIYSKFHTDVDTLMPLVSCEGRSVYIWGASGSGKSYLLQAVCQALTQIDYTVAYLPLKLLKDLDPAVLEGMADYQLVAVDDIEQIAGHSAWEEALFHLYNRLQTQQHTFIVTGQVSAANTQLHLADLRSRLTHALILQIHELGDEDKIYTLQLRAKKRGLALSHSVGHYILNRCARNLHDLQSILDRLDHASLVAKRKLTIPFVKKILGV